MKQQEIRQAAIFAAVVVTVMHSPQAQGDTPVPANGQEEKSEPLSELQVTTSSGTTRIIAKPASVMLATLKERRQKLKKPQQNRSDEKLQKKLEYPS